MAASQLCSAPSPLFSQVTLGDVIDDEADYWLSSAGMVLDRPSLAALTRPVSRPPVQGATVDVETTTITTLEGSASGRFSWPKSYNLLRLFGMLALFCLGAAFAHSSYSATAALLSSQRYDPSPWPTSPPATVAKPFAPASPNGFCEVGDTSSFEAIVSSDSAPANQPVRASRAS